MKNMLQEQKKEVNSVEASLYAMAAKCLTQTKNRLFFSYQALSPAIYRMPIEMLKIGCDQFGTDAAKIYVDPIRVIEAYRSAPEKLMRQYLHMLFHCIYLHPFQILPAGKDTNVDLWNLAMDICTEAAVVRLDNVMYAEEDGRRKAVIKELKDVIKIKMFIPGLVYKVLINNGSIAGIGIAELCEIFCMDDHLWLNHSGSGNGQDNQNNSNGDGKGDGQGQDDNQSDNDNSNGNSGNSNQDQQKKQEWSDVSRQISTDMQSFNKMQGKNAGSMIDEIDYITKDKMDYSDFLRQFATVEEVMKVNQDEFDYMYYTYGLSLDTPTGDKMLLIEPLEYKDEKVVKEFVIAIDTSGSCSGDLVKKFINKTYSMLKASESFSSRVNIHIIQCDATVQKDVKITTQEEMEKYLHEMKLYGFGGTDFRPVFEYVDTLIKQKEFDNLCGLIYFTDGYGTYPSSPTQYKTAFAFLEDYNNRDNVPSWAMSVYWNGDEEE